MMLMKKIRIQAQTMNLKKVITQNLIQKQKIKYIIYLFLFQYLYNGVFGQVLYDKFPKLQLVDQPLPFDDDHMNTIRRLEKLINTVSHSKITINEIKLKLDSIFEKNLVEDSIWCIASYIKIDSGYYLFQKNMITGRIKHCNSCVDKVFLYVPLWKVIWFYYIDNCLLRLNYNIPNNAKEAKDLWYLIRDMMKLMKVNEEGSSQFRFLQLIKEMLNWN